MLVPLGLVFDDSEARAVVYAVVGRDVDDGFELVVASADGSGGVVYRSPEHARLLDADDDVAAISHPSAGDLFHPIVRIVDLSDGRIVAELDDQGLGVTPIAFSPARDRRLLVTHSRHDRKGLLIWSTDTDAVQEVVVDLDGDVSGQWLSDASGLLLVSSLDGRDVLYKLDLASGSLDRLDAPCGVVDEYSPRNDGTAQASGFSASDLLARLYQMAGDRTASDATAARARALYDRLGASSFRRSLDDALVTTRPS